MEDESSLEMTSVAITIGLKVSGKPATLSDKPAALSDKPATHSGKSGKVAAFAPDSVAGFLRIQWPVSFGFSGRFGPEHAAYGAVKH